MINNFPYFILYCYFHNLFCFHSNISNNNPKQHNKQFHKFNSLTQSPQMKDNNLDDIFLFSNPICKQTYNSLPKIYGGYRENKSYKEIKNKLLFKPIRHQCIQKISEAVLTKSKTSARKRYSQMKSKYLSMPKGQKCNKRYCLCSMIHQQQSKTLRKNRSASSPKKMKMKLRPIQEFKPDDFQSEHKVAIRVCTEPNMPLGLGSLVNIINSKKNAKAEKQFQKQESLIDQLIIHEDIDDGRETKRRANKRKSQQKDKENGKESGYVTGNESNEKMNIYKCYTESVAIGTDNAEGNYENRASLRYGQSGVPSRTSVLTPKQTSCAEVQVNLDQDAIEKRSQKLQQQEEQTGVGTQTVGKNNTISSIKNKKNENKFRKLTTGVRKTKYYISEEEDNEQQQMYDKQDKKIKNSNNPSRLSQLRHQSPLSLSSCLIKKIGMKPTEFKKLNMIENQQNLRVSRINSVKSNGTFRVPKRQEYASYLKAYRIMDKKSFNLKQLVKKPLFTIVQEEEGAGVYFGQYKGENKIGCGLYVTEKEIFEGIYQADKKLKGCQRNIDGVYRGYFVNGKRQGYGTFQWNNGQKFEGNWKEGVKCGFGIWRSPKGDYYEGEWFNNRQQGEGVFKHRNSTYKGTFQNFLKHGKGQERFTNGDVYVGDYLSGKPDGFGKYSWADGSVYEGQFKKGLRCGHGKWVEVNGNIYQGEFQNDFRHGEGKLWYSSGQVFEGFFKNGKQSQGTLISKQGKVEQINNQQQQNNQ